MNNGKGDRQRPTNLRNYEENYERIFSPRKTISEWAKLCKVFILDADGFPEYNSDDLLTKSQFTKGIIRSTVQIEDMDHFSKMLE